MTLCEALMAKDEQRMKLLTWVMLPPGYDKPLTIRARAYAVVYLRLAFPALDHVDIKAGRIGLELGGQVRWIDAPGDIRTPMEVRRFVDQQIDRLVDEEMMG